MNQHRRTFLKTAAGTSLGAGLFMANNARAAETQAELQTKSLKILALNTSHRAGGTTAAALKIAIEAIEKADKNISCELLELANLKLNFISVGGDTPADDFGKIADIVKLPEFAGFIIGSPVYFGAMSGMCKTMIDRFMEFKKTLLLRNKVFGAIAVGGNRNGGQEFTINGIRNCLSSQQVVLAQDAPPTSHWGATLWSQDGSIEKDEFGTATARNLGMRIAELARMVTVADMAQWV